MPDYTQRFPVDSYELDSADNAKSSLSASIDDVAETILLEDKLADDVYANFPEGIGSENPPFVITLENEKVLISRRSGDTLIVYSEDDEGLGYLGAGQIGRGYDGSIAASHAADIQVYLFVTSAQNKEIRNAIAALQENKPESTDTMLLDGSNPMEDDLDLGGFILERADIIELVERGGNPSQIAGRGQLYARDIDGMSDLHFLDDTGQATRITANGQLNAANVLTFLGDGSDGAINITSGTTNIASGTLHQYTSITVSGTGKLSTSSTSGLMAIAVIGNVTVSVAGGLDFSGKCTSQTDITYTLLGGDALDYVGPENGGAGGAGHKAGTVANSSGGAQGSGYGGGGGGGSLEQAAARVGGNGGAGGFPCDPGAASPGTDANGIAGTNSAGGSGAGGAAVAGGAGGGTTHGTAGTSSGANTGGGGGAGGLIGGSALPLMLNVGGNANFSGGGLLCKGDNGGTGGAGGTATAAGGGGGGGGAGNGADVLIRYVGTYTAGTMTVTNGTGGSGGAVGTGGSGGANGSAGTSGSASAAVTTRKVYPQM